MTMRENEHHDALDCLIEEAVGGVRPPDLTARVKDLMRAHPDGEMPESARRVRSEARALHAVDAVEETLERSQPSVLGRVLWIGASLSAAACLVLALVWDRGAVPNEVPSPATNSAATFPPSETNDPPLPVSEPLPPHRSTLVPTIVTSSEELRSLDPDTASLTASALSDHDLSRIAVLPKLRVLNLANSPNITGNGLAGLASCAMLEELNLYGCGRVDDAGMAGIGGMAKLRALDVSHTAVSDAGLRSIGRMASLESLHLCGLPITDVGLRNLNRLVRVTELQLWNCQSITTGGLVGLAGHMSLRLLGVRNCIGVPMSDDVRLQQAFPDAEIVR